ncbi:response regulator [Amedibacterium intestinale]|uniref:DNA-binding response regulator n=1 Tax=Amedibacterium intestinale TaxID=2583452 RepID=A0A6N4TIQ3_9FIRM|nr:response regulator [Amedibacterium intestinale]RHO21457.1 response regulator [Eubacterium sp. AM18-26]RHO28440.1 response regulator [Eubacterium sp. AM18-10LB-B]BBK22364.1 DNA-binding response regulator [Amedibacterium intestinale]BBK62420.1 DNA-binding response regulator [Amedibacterium intestinale]
MLNEIQPVILIVEDDIQIRNFIRFALENEKYKVLTSENAAQAMNEIVSEPMDLILLDLGLPDADGMEVIKKVREFSDIPIIVVSARDQDKEKVKALDYGADDYLVKPFSASELLARIRVAFRHLEKIGKEEVMQNGKVGELMIDFSKHLVYLKGEELHVTPMEYRLLSVFFKNIGKVLTTSYIIQEVYGKNYGNDTQALRALMAALRRKIEDSPARPRYIMTEIGVGYRLVDE